MSVKEQIQNIKRKIRSKRWDKKSDKQKEIANYKYKRKNAHWSGEVAIDSQRDEALDQKRTGDFIKGAKKNKRRKVGNLRGQMNKKQMAEVQEHRKNPPDNKGKDFFSDEYTQDQSKGIGSKKEGRKAIRKARKTKRATIRGERKERREEKKYWRGEKKEHRKTTRKVVKKIRKGY